MTTANTMARPKSKRKQPVPRPSKETKPDSYSARVSARLRALRKERRWSVKKLKEKLEEVGEPVKLSTLYAYELGRSEGGVDIPLELVPAIATVFGFKTPGGWLPPE